MVRDSADGREPIRRGVFHDDSLGRGRVRTRQSVGGAWRRALCGGWLLHLPSGGTEDRATRKGALGGEFSRVRLRGSSQKVPWTRLARNPSPDSLPIQGYVPYVRETMQPAHASLWLRPNGMDAKEDVAR